MALNYSPRIVRDGLVLALDAADKNSYPGSGTTWYDLSGKGNHATLYNGPTFSTSNIGCFTFDGSNDYADVSLNLRTSNNTMMIIGRYVTLTGRMLGGISNNYLCGTWNTYTNQFYGEGWISGPYGYQDTNWHIYHGSTNIGNTGTPNGTQFYNNGTGLVVNGGGGYGPQGIRIGSDGVYNEYANCQVAYVAAYNRCLTRGEILQNYNAFKTRFGV
jgi:hypothetical protein